MKNYPRIQEALKDTEPSVKGQGQGAGARGSNNIQLIQDKQGFALDSGFYLITTCSMANTKQKGSDNLHRGKKHICP